MQPGRGFVNKILAELRSSGDNSVKIGKCDTRCANHNTLIAAFVVLVSFASWPAHAANLYRFVIKTTFADCTSKCDIGVIESDEKMSKAECEKALRVAKSIMRKRGLKIKSAKCVIIAR